MQEALGRLAPPPWQPPGALHTLRIAGCFICFGRGEPRDGGELGVAGAAVCRGRRVLAATAVHGSVGAAYVPFLLALREGPLLEAAVRALPRTPPLIPDVLVVNASGRDHPRRAGLAVHLGAVLDLPTVGLTNRPLVASGGWPPDERGATAPFYLDGTVVGHWLRTRAGAKPVAVHAAWRTDPESAVEVVLASIRRARTAEPLRRARTLARATRSRLGG